MSASMSRTLAMVAFLASFFAFGSARAQVSVDAGAALSTPPASQSGVERTSVPALAPSPTTSPVASAPPTEPPPPTEPVRAVTTPPWLDIHGYVQPAFGARYRGAAVPRDRWNYGALSSRAGVVLSGERIQHWKYVVHFALDSNLIRVVSGVDVDRDATGAVREVRASNRDIVGVALEEISLAYEPFPWLSFKGGQLRIPFTVGHRSANFALMFPQRAGPNEVFLSGADRGGLVSVDVGKGVFTGSLGMFDGSSLTLFREPTSSRGILYSARVDVNPLGRMAMNEADLLRGPLRFGIGFGLLYRPATLFDRTGYESIATADTRVSASLRASFRGLYLQAEAMKRQFTDSLSSRPNRATGIYAQASYFAPLSRKIAIAPIARVGETVIDEDTVPRKVVFFEGGLSFFPAADDAQPDALRITAQYQGERRVTEGEDAHGAVLQLQYLF